jgi:hypothetical protein
LRILATGGVYLGGGLPRRLLPLLKAPGFLARFADKGRLSSLLARMPLHVIVRPNVGLRGAIRWASALTDSAADASPPNALTLPPEGAPAAGSPWGASRG